jgi:translation initiation factor 3 subunit H
MADKMADKRKQIPAPQQADEKEEEAPSESVRVVQLDGLVLLKILKHCKENGVKQVTGQLLGLDVNGRLEVTNAFPYPSDSSEENDAYQIEMMKCLRTVNVDNNTVGWYQSAFLSNFFTQSVVDAQVAFQKEIPASVLVVYDPQRTTAGRLALKAYRLTDVYMAQFTSGAAASKAPAKKSEALSGEIFEEVPIKVHNSHLVHAFLYELREHKAMRCELDRLTLTANPFLEKNLELISAAIDDLGAEQSKFQFHQRQVARQKQQQQQHIQKIEEDNESRKLLGKTPLPAEDFSKNPIFKPLAKPSHLESHLISNRVNLHCSQITSSATLAFNKLYIIDALQKQDQKPKFV